MRVGLSFGRCVRDIVLGTVPKEDVLFIVAQTRAPSLGNLLDIAKNHYIHDVNRFMGLDQGKLVQTIEDLWYDGKIHQPRTFNDTDWFKFAGNINQHHWMDLVPVNLNDNPAMKEAWDNYRTILTLTGE